LSLSNRLNRFERKLRTQTVPIAKANRQLYTNKVRYAVIDSPTHTPSRNDGPYFRAAGSLSMRGRRCTRPQPPLSHHCSQQDLEKKHQQSLLLPLLKPSHHQSRARQRSLSPRSTNPLRTWNWYSASVTLSYTPSSYQCYSPPTATA
jgi:hypothetical protein